MTPVILDLFCGAGGASMGYAKAGFTVVGVDKRDQLHYPFEFHQADAVEFLIDHGHEFDAVHASPPCQGYSKHTKPDSKHVAHTKGSNEPQLIDVVREHMPNVPWIIENVYGAREHMDNPFTLVGFMFGLPFKRKRLFESNVLIMVPPVPKNNGAAKRYADEHGIDVRDLSVTGKSRRSGSIDTWKRVMEMPWCEHARELSEAIPPKYTEHIGRQLAAHITKTK